MQLPFGHKGGEQVGAIPVDEVRNLRAQGKADREIIVELKKRGHSFESIEKAMLQVLKGGAVPGGAQAGSAYMGQMGNQSMGPSQAQYPRQQFNPQQGALNAPQFGPGQRPQGTFQPSQGQGYGSNLATRESLIPQTNMNIQIGGVVPLEAEAGAPSDIIEEVVEGVVEEKFEKSDQKFEAIGKDIAKGKEDAEGLKSLMVSSLQKRDKDIEDLRQSVKSMRDDIEDLLVKSAALEKAFKQFLPDITEKVRSQNAERKVESAEL